MQRWPLFQAQCWRHSLPIDRAKKRIIERPLWLCGSDLFNHVNQSRHGAKALCIRESHVCLDVELLLRHRRLDEQHIAERFFGGAQKRRHF